MPVARLWSFLVFSQVHESMQVATLREIQKKVEEIQKKKRSPRKNSPTLNEIVSAVGFKRNIYSSWLVNLPPPNVPPWEIRV